MIENKRENNRKWWKRNVKEKREGDEVERILEWVLKKRERKKENKWEIMEWEGKNERWRGNKRATKEERKKKNETVILSVQTKEDNHWKINDRKMDINLLSTFKNMEKQFC